MGRRIERRIWDVKSAGAEPSFGSLTKSVEGGGMVANQSNNVRLPIAVGAVSRSGLIDLGRILAGVARVIPVYHVDEAGWWVSHGADILICGAHCELPGVDALSSLAGAAAQNSLPVVYCRFEGEDLRLGGLDLEIAARLEDASAAYIDLPALVEQYGQAGAEREFRQRVIARVREVRQGSASPAGGSAGNLAVRAVI